MVWYGMDRVGMVGGGRTETSFESTGAPTERL